MRLIVTDGIAWALSQYVTIMRPTLLRKPSKMAEPIEVPYGCGHWWAKGTTY